MAFVPDDAMRRAVADKLTPAQWFVYERLCAFRNARDGVVWAVHATNARLVEWTGLKLGTVKNALVALRRKGWISDLGDAYALNVGTFLAAESPAKPSLHSDAPSLHSDAPSLHSDAPSLHSDAPSLHSDGATTNVRARVLTSHRPARTKHTHTGRGRSSTRRGSGCAACVCVSGEGVKNLAGAGRQEHPPPPRPLPVINPVVEIACSRHPRDVLWRYAAAYGLGGGWVTQAWRRGEWDAEVDKFLASGGVPSGRTNGLTDEQFDALLQADDARKLEAARADKSRAAGVG